MLSVLQLGMLGVLLQNKLAAQCSLLDFVCIAATSIVSVLQLDVLSMMPDSKAQPLCLLAVAWCLLSMIPEPRPCRQVSGPNFACVVILGFSYI